MKYKYKSVFEAARLRLRADAYKSLSTIEVLLDGQSDGNVDEVVDTICEQARNLAMGEGALITLEQYFNKQPNVPQRPAHMDPYPAPPSPPPVNAGPPLKVTPERSPTYKKSVEKEKIKKSARKARPSRAKAAAENEKE
jgi:hypothetical protein